MNYLAHINDCGEKQPLSDHLTGVSALCEAFASVFGGESEGKLCGLIHDAGKFSEDFQKRLLGGAKRVDHSTAGALVAISVLKNPVISMCIAGHHSGLLNIGSIKNSYYGDGTFCGRHRAVVDVDIPDYSAYSEEIQLKQPSFPPPMLDRRTLFSRTHMLFSCLVDADFLDTECFMSEAPVKRGNNTSLKELSDKLDNYIKPRMSPSSDINRKRCEILTSLLNHADTERGLFSLTVPTGGGKTVSSMAFALHHALANNMANGEKFRRIIYIIPYVSIIEQTQTVFEKIFGRENVLAHYSNMDFSEKSDDVNDRKKLAAENWDAPVILTTAVQFFESFFSNRPSFCRKLHNICGSVLIFDEAQMLPPQCITPCLWAVSELVKNYFCSAVLCTATKPAFDNILNTLLPEYPVRELCPDPKNMYECFKRVTYVNIGDVTDDDLSKKLLSSQQVLCIVNTKKSAQITYELIKGDGSFHLSTSMIPEDRRNILENIRARLSEGKTCRVISTSLIEAGVDVDFPCVYREYAGLDSIIQAGGRCNREGKRMKNESFVYYFKTERKAPPYIRQNLSAAEHTIRKYTDISSPEAIDDYFSFLLYTLRNEEARDTKEIMKNIDERSDFEDIANDFKIIDDSGYNIIIPKGEGIALVGQLKQFGINRKLMRKLGRYTVGVYKDYYDALISGGKAELLSENTAILTDMNIYSDETGLMTVLPGMGTLIY